MKGEVDWEMAHPRVHAIGFRRRSRASRGATKKGVWRRQSHADGKYSCARRRRGVLGQTTDISSPTFDLTHSEHLLPSASRLDPRGGVRLRRRVTKVHDSPRRFPVGIRIGVHGVSQQRRGLPFRFPGFRASRLRCATHRGDGRVRASSDAYTWKARTRSPRSIGGDEDAGGSAAQ